MLTTERWTILVVEDEPVLRDLMRRMLEKRDYQVLVAEDGKSALNLAQTHTEGIDLLIADVVMPEMDGFEVATRVTESHPLLRVLFLTGHAGESPQVAQRLEACGGPVLRKPFTQASLVEQIENLLETPSLRLV
jgi:CheY-like chemotaxis protein